MKVFTVIATVRAPDDWDAFDVEAEVEDIINNVTEDTEIDIRVVKVRVMKHMENHEQHS